MLLAVDTATRFASIALYDGSGVIAEESWRSDNNHSREVLPSISDMLARQGLGPDDLTAVAVAIGPGSFTGLRIGLSIAKGLCLALGIPIIAIPTLDITTYAVGDPGGPVVAVLEAGRGRICVASYHFEEGLPVQDGQASVVKVSEWDAQLIDAVLVAGEIGPDVAERLLDQGGCESVAISSLAGSVRRAGYLAELAWDRLEQGRVEDLDSLSPIYTHYPSPTAAHLAAKHT